MSIVWLEYQFSSEVIAPPTSNQIRLNGGHPYTDVTRLWIRNLTSDGADMRRLLLAIPIGSAVTVQDKNDSTAYGKFRVTAPALDDASYVSLPVVWADNGLALLNNQAVSVFVVTPVEAPPPPAGGTEPPAMKPPLVTQAQAAAHLRLGDVATLPPDHAADLELKIHAASQAIGDYLKSGFDPTWVAATSPADVQAAVLFYLAHLYEHRGEDLAPSNFDDAVWMSIERLLHRRRDPALA